MKKFIYSIVAFLLVIPVALGLVACNNEAPKTETVDLTEANVVGDWEVSNVTYTPGTGVTIQADSCTKAEWDVLDGTDYAELTQAQKDKWDLFDGFFHSYRLKAEDHKMYDITDGSETEAASWAIDNGEITYEESLPGYAADSVVWNNGSIVLTVTIPAGDYAGTYVLTLAKVTA